MAKEVSGAMKRMKYGNYIIGVKTNKQMNGMTAAWVTQVSTHPLLVMIAIGKTHYTSEMIAEAGSFSVNMLRPDQFELARKCGFGTGKGKDRLEGVGIQYKKTGAPVLTDCSAYLDCKLFKSFEAGDHMLFIGEVVDMEDTGADLMVHDEVAFFGKRGVEMETRMVKPCETRLFMDGPEVCREYCKTGKFTFGASTLLPGQTGSVDPGHPVSKEIFFVSRGHVIMHTPDDSKYYELHEGDIIIIPEGKPHQMSNVGENIALITWSLIPTP